MSQTRKWLWLDEAAQRIVHSLIHRWLDPVIAATYIADLRHLPSHEIADPEACKVSLSMQLVNLRARFLQTALSGLIRGDTTCGSSQLAALFRDLIRFSRRCSSLWDHWSPGIFRATVG